MTDDDLYAILEVSSGASSTEIRAAFRRLARAYHPDLGGGSAEHMALLNRAYAVLSDPEQRRRYDARRTSIPEAPLPPIEPPPVEHAPPDDSPWRLDLERGENMDDWRQMYAEERQVWEQLLRSRSTPDPAIQRALERSKREQLELENAIRARSGRASLTPADLETQLIEQRQVEPARHGCFAVLLSLLLSRLTR